MTRRLEELSHQECLRLLAQHYVGRVGFVHAGEPQVLPVNYRFVHGIVVFRAAKGLLLDVTKQERAVFEIDGVSIEDHEGWSVVVHGTPEEVLAPDELAKLAALPLRPWAPGDRDHYVRIVPRSVTGRRIR